jgi:hypothetical protein
MDCRCLLEMSALSQERKEEEDKKKKIKDVHETAA